MPAFPWATPVREVIVPCTGRLQPEHLLKPFEAGANLVAVVACQEGNCHYGEGSCRAQRRCEFVGGLLDQIGLSRDRLMVFQLTGSARQDMAVGSPKADNRPLVNEAALAIQISTIATQVAQRLSELPTSPLRASAAALQEIDGSEAEEAEENED